MTYDYFKVKRVDRNLSYKFIKSDYLVVDIGGAGGIDAFNMAERAEFVVILDINHNKLNVAKNNCKLKKFTQKMGFIISSATSLPFRTNIFDLITSFSVLDHVPNKKAFATAIREFARVVKFYRLISVTLPNTLFLVGTLASNLRMLSSNAYFEQRFTPKELALCMKSNGLQILKFDSMSPEEIGDVLIKHNVPPIFLKLPGHLFFFPIIEKLSKIINNSLHLKIFGARFGYLSIKINTSSG